MICSYEPQFFLEHAIRPQPLLEHPSFQSFICAFYSLYRFCELISVLMQGFLLCMCDPGEYDHCYDFLLSDNKFDDEEVT